MSFVIEEGKLVDYVGSDLEVRIPEEVTRIGTGAFTGAAIDRLYIPGTNPTIEWDAFKGMTTLNIVVAYEGVGPYWKHFNAKTVIILPEDMEEVPADILAEAKSGLRTGLILVDGIKTLRANSLWEYSTPKLELPKTITIIEKEAFVGGRYEEIVIPSSCFMVNSGAFANCTISKLTFLGTPIIQDELWGDFANMASSVLEIDAPKELLEKYADVFKKTSYFEKIEREKKAIEAAEAKEKEIEGWKNAGLCQYDGGSYNLFKKCKNCGRKRDY